VPEHVCQLDVHHRDGDHANNNEQNLMTLCANCHRLEHAPEKSGPA
jgi:5-methylcytosine-specific restriction endonuclease McrA